MCQISILIGFKKNCFSMIRKKTFFLRSPLYSSYPPFGPPSSVHTGSSTLEGVLKNGAAAAAAAAMNMHTMQLEWLARTGMLYHRFPELAGKFQSNIKL